MSTTSNGRRTFITGIGAGVSAGLASAAAIAGPGPASSGDSLRLALLEAENAVRKLHRDFQQALDDGRYDDVASLFTADARVVFNGGVFDQRRNGVNRLFGDVFRASKSGVSMQQAPGFALAASETQERVDIAADLLSATAVFPFTVRMGKPVETESSIGSMARLQGEGVQFWWEGGLYLIAFAKDELVAQWKIRRLEYDTRARADYRPGRSEARPVAVEPFAAVWPLDPSGPDALV